MGDFNIDDLFSFSGSVIGVLVGLVIFFVLLIGFMDSEKNEDGYRTIFGFNAFYLALITGFGGLFVGNFIGVAVSSLNSVVLFK